jgi:pSer/pThr/pTyr-binding forkhead associated (FHA) protein
MEATIVQKYSLEAFLEACGAHGPLLLDVRGGDGTDAFRRALHQPFALVGGASAADLQLKDPGVSRRHGYLQMIAGRAYYVDFGSLASVRGSTARLLSCRQSLRLGAHQLRLLRGPAPGADKEPDDLRPLASGSAAQLGIPPLVLEVVDGDSVKTRWRMNRLVVLLGSAPGCSIRLAAGKHSAVEGSLVATPRGTWLVDLLGRSGVHLNAVQARVARVEDGDTLRVGDAVIRLRYDDARPSQASPREPRVGSAMRLDRPTTVAPQETGSPARLGSSEQNGALVPAFLAGGGRQALAHPTAPEDNGLGAVILPLLGQFNQMQLQLSEQFQQAALQMFQLFGALHRDQMGSLREEFDRQSRLTQELRQLQEELTKLQTTAATSRSGHTPAAAPVRSAPHAAPPGKAVAPAAGPATPAGGTPAMTAGTAAAGDRPAANGQDVHTWLCRRMEALQQERQTGWQKILGFLVGKRSDETVP